MKMKALGFSATSGTAHPKTQCHIPKTESSVFFCLGMIAGLSFISLETK